MKNNSYLINFIKAALLLQLIGCLKEPDKKIKYGPEVPVDLVIQSLKSAQGPTHSPLQILKGESVKIETTREIRGRPVIDVLTKLSIEVLETKETSHQWQVRSKEIFKHYDLDAPFQEPPEIIDEDHQCWIKENMKREDCEIDSMTAFLGDTITSQANSSRNANSASDSQNLSKKPIYDLLNTERHFSFLMEEHLYPYKQLLPLKYQSVDNPATGSSEFQSRTFHNHTVTKVILAPPAAVQNAENCQGIPNCKINATILEFDEVNWKLDPNGYKIHYKFAISPDVPQLSRNLQVCKQGSIQVKLPDKPIEEAPRFLVTFCDTVLDFKRGTL